MSDVSIEDWMPLMKNEILAMLREVSAEYYKSFNSENHKSKSYSFKKIDELYASVRKVVIVKLDAIGDWIMFYNSYKKIKELFPNAKVSLIVYEDLRETIGNYKNIDEFLTVKRKPLMFDKRYKEHLLAYLRNTDFDILINPLFSREFNSDLICHFTNAKIKIGVNGDNSNILEDISKFTDSWYDYILPVDRAKVIFELERNNEIVSLLGYKNAEVKLPEIPISEKDETAVKELIFENHIEDFALVFPGTRGAEKSIKFWDIDKYARVVDYLHEKGLKVIILGGEEEENICYSIAARSQLRPRVIVNQTTIWQSAAILKLAKIYVGSDTSMAHISAAIGIPTVVLLGGGHFGRFFPYPGNPNVKAVYKKMNCYNCNWECKKETVECIKNIEVKDVTDACEKFITENQNISNKKYVNRTVNYIKKAGSAPRIDLVLPSGNHSWHLKEGILKTLKRSDMLNKVFVLSENNIADFFNYITNSISSDMIFAPGGDHHLPYLHDTFEKRLLWDKVNIPKVCYSYESTIESIYPQYKVRAANSFNVFTHFLYTDEVDASMYKENSLAAMYFPQFADENMFRNTTPFSKRKRKMMFCGKLWEEYPERKKIINSLQGIGLCDTYTSVKTLELIALYNQYGISINPPGVLGGFNVRTFEALAAGSLLFQCRHENRPLNNSLFEDNKHLLYFEKSDVQGLINKASYAIKNYGDYEKVALDGYNEFLAKHTTAIRMNTMINWIFDSSSVLETDNISKAVNITFTGQTPEKVMGSESKAQILLSAIVSTYNSELFIEGCLNDLVGQSIYKKGLMEIIVIDSASQENEKTIVEEYQKKYDNIKYIRTIEREGIYKAWNRAIEIASGEYITNANTDDRHAENALEKLVNFLENNKEYAVVYANDLQTTIPNDTFNSRSEKTQLNWSEFDKDLLLFGCYLGPHPVWKKSLHDVYGLFDESLNVVGDYEFWLRVSDGAKICHLNETLGLYYYSGSSAEHRDPELTGTEHGNVQKKYLIKYLNTELDIKRVQMKLDFLKKMLSDQKYLHNAALLVDRRFAGLQLEKKIYEFSTNETLLDDPGFLTQIEEFLTAVESNNIIVDRSLFVGILYSLKAIYYLTVHDAEAAKEYFTKSLMNDPQNNTSLQGLRSIYGKRTDSFVHCLLIISEDLLNQDRLTDAKFILERVLEYDFNNLDALNNLAAIEILSGSIANASEIIQKALRVDAANEIAINNLNYIKQLITE